MGMQSTGRQSSGGRQYSQKGRRLAERKRRGPTPEKDRRQGSEAPRPSDEEEEEE